MTTVAFTGHRSLPASEHAWCQHKLAEVCKRAASAGADWFMGSGDPGSNWWFLDAALGLEDYEYGFKNGIVVALVQPHKHYLNFYIKKNEEYSRKIHELIGRVSTIITVTYEENPNSLIDKVGILHTKNKFLVNESDYLIGIYDGRKDGGTKYTMSYAREQGKKILWINPETKKERWI